MQSLLNQLCTLAAQPPAALADEAFALALDAQDTVIRREHFAYPQVADGSGDCIYLCGNSLGLQPLSARTFINEELDSWATCATLPLRASACALAYSSLCLRRCADTV